MRVVNTPPSITASQLLHLISTGRWATITCISFASRRLTSGERCQTHAILTLAKASPSTWGSARPPIALPNLPIDKAASSAVCLSMRELGNSLWMCEELAPKCGSVLQDLIFDWITSTQIRGIGSEEVAYNTMLFSGEKTSIVTWLSPLGINELLLFWMTCLRWSIKPESWESAWASLQVEDILYSSGTSRITAISQMSGIGYKIWKMLEYEY